MASWPAGLGLDLIMVDRDGVLNRNLSQGVLCRADWEWLPGSVTAIRMLADLGLSLAVVTNQEYVGRGLLTAAGLAAIHDGMVADLGEAGRALIGVFFCPHRTDAGCTCRKPAPGLMDAALRISGVAADRALVVGDHSTDIAAAEAAGCWSLHVRSGRGAPPTGPARRYLGSVADLLAAGRLIANLRSGSQLAPEAPV